MLDLFEANNSTRSTSKNTLLGRVQTKMSPAVVEEAPWSNGCPPFVTPPYYPDRFAFDVVYDRRSYPGGAALRCHIEIRRPALFPSAFGGSPRLSSGSNTVSLGLCTFQFIGVVTAVNPEFSGQLRYIKAAADPRIANASTPGNSEEKAFWSSLKLDAEKALLNKQHNPTPATVAYTCQLKRQTLTTSKPFFFPDSSYTPAVGG